MLEAKRKNKSHFILCFNNSNTTTKTITKSPFSFTKMLFVRIYGKKPKSKPKQPLIPSSKTKVEQEAFLLKVMPKLSAIIPSLFGLDPKRGSHPLRFSLLSVIILCLLMLLRLEIEKNKKPIPRPYNPAPIC